MTEETIFSSDQEEAPKTTEATSQESVATPSAPSIPTELQDYVGEGKKYKSMDEVYKAFPNAQKHISTLETEMAQLKEELQKRRTAQELLDDIRNGIKQPESTSQGVELNQDVVSEIVRKELTRTKQSELQEQNTSLVRDSFLNTFGDKAEAMYNKIAEDSGLSVAELNSLTAKSPKAVLRLAGLEGKKQSIPGKTSSDVNTQSLNTNIQQNDGKLGLYPNSKDLANAWKASRDKVLAQYNKG